MRVGPRLFGFGMLLLLSACGKGELFNMDGDTKKPIPPTGGASVENAACICGHRDGSWSALFTSKPGSFGKSSMRVYSNSCQTTVFCEDLGGGTFSLVEGKTISMSNLLGRWSSTQNYRGQTYYEARGTASVSFSLPPVTEPQVVFAALHLMKAAFSTPNGKTCQETCASGDPSCFALNLPDTQSAGLRELQKMLSVQPAQVDQSDVAALFGMNDDPCGRSDTTISNGTFTNTAEGRCNLDTDVPNSNVSLIIEVPERVTGSWSQSGDDILVLMDENLPKPTLSFVPTDASQSTADAEGLQVDFGGEISELFAVKGGLGFGVGGGSCIMGTFE